MAEKPREFLEWDPPRGVIVRAVSEGSIQNYMERILKDGIFQRRVFDVIASLRAAYPESTDRPDIRANILAAEQIMESTESAGKTPKTVPAIPKKPKKPKK